MTDIMTEIIALLVSGIKGLCEGVAQGIIAMVTSLFLNTEGTGLSIFGGLVVIFAGISLAIGLSRWALNFITSLGARNK